MSTTRANTKSSTGSDEFKPTRTFADVYSKVSTLMGMYLPSRKIWASSAAQAVADSGMGSPLMQASVLGPLLSEAAEEAGIPYSSAAHYAMFLAAMFINGRASLPDGGPEPRWNEHGDNESHDTFDWRMDEWYRGRDEQVKQHLLQHLVASYAAIGTLYVAEECMGLPGIEAAMSAAGVQGAICSMSPATRDRALVAVAGLKQSTIDAVCDELDCLIASAEREPESPVAPPSEPGSLV